MTQLSENADTERRVCASHVRARTLPYPALGFALGFQYRYGGNGRHGLRRHALFRTDAVRN